MSSLGLGPVVDADIDDIVSQDLPWETLRGSTVLVTGANGMLPSYTLFALLKLNDTLDLGITALALVRNEDKARRILGPILDRPDVQLIATDVTQLSDLPGPLDYVVHGASAARPILHGTDPVATIKANLLGSFNLLDLCVRKGAKGFVLMSSAEVYGNQPADIELIPEDSYGGFDFLNPRASYSEGKRAAETIASVYAHQHGMTARMVRFGHIYGPGMALDDGRVQADFTANVVRGEDIVLNSDGTAVRTYTYVSDAVSGMFHALLLGDQLAYNVADPAGKVAIRDLAQVFVDARPAKGLKRVFTNPDHHAASYNPAKFQGLDSSRLEALGWRPHVPLADGVDRTIRSHESD